VEHPIWLFKPQMMYQYNSTGILDSQNQTKAAFGANIGHFI
jgi:hypothetical protein